MLQRKYLSYIYCRIKVSETISRIAQPAGQLAYFNPFIRGMPHFCDAQLQIICFKPTKPRKTGAIIERSKSEIDVVEASSLYPFVIREWKIPSFILQDCIYFIFDPLQRRNLKLPAGFKSTKPQKQRCILLTKKCIRENQKHQGWLRLTRSCICTKIWAESH